ncbi:MAG TPA: phenylalanine--tRNA ligase subunit beta, partial [Microbacteriaceae bacterium]|nr:phenylalanine--tRNA ligase subunit beta [Microbacteriaceae bacterium]
GSPVASIKLANPLDGQAPYLRRSLLPGLMAVAHRNLARGFTDLSLFELGSVFLPEEGVRYGTDEVPLAAQRPTRETIEALAAAIPPQPRHVGVLLLGSLVPKQAGQAPVAAGVADALDAVRTIAAAIGVRIDVEQGTHAALHPGRTGVLTIAGEPVGYVGELLPALAEEADLPARVAVAELDLDRAISFAGDAVTAAHLSTFTPATQDVSLVVPVATTAAQVRLALLEGAGELLESVRLVDDYRGEGMPEGSKSLSFALRFRAPDRTLTAAEASEAKLAGVAVAAERFGARIRD